MTEKNAPRLSVTDPVGPAIDLLSPILFKPFRLKRWLLLGFITSLPMVGEGLNPIVQLIPHSLHFVEIPPFETIALWLQAHLAKFLLWSIIIILVLFVFYLFARWVSCRGSFVLYDNVVHQHDQIKAPWREFRTLGNSLLKFRLGWDLLIGNVLLILALIAGWIAWPDFLHYIIEDHYVVTRASRNALLFFAAGFFITGIPLWLLSMMISHIMLPVMYVRRMPAWPAFKHSWREMVKPHFGPCILYFLLQIVIGMITGMLGQIGVFITCFLAFIAAFIPLIGHYPLMVFMLPGLIFQRAYELRFIGQFGPEYQVPWPASDRRGFPVTFDEGHAEA